MVARTAVRRSVPAGELPSFTPVPRRVARHDGWTPARQIAFIEALADTGCVAIAARMVNMSQASVYQLRRQPGAESFRAAMDAAQALGLQRVKDEAFDRAMNGQLVPVFVAGKLMGFRRKKNDRLLMFILRNYGFGPGGTRTTVNYVSTRAAAAATAPLPLAGEGKPRSGEGEGAAWEPRPASPPAADPSAIALAKAEASATTVRTIISGPDRGAASIGIDDDRAANLLNAFEGVDLDAGARDRIYDALAACAERRRALEDDPENDPERFFVGAAETNGYLGELESGAEGDWVEYRPEGEHRWEGLGEGGEAAEIDEVLRGMKERWPLLRLPLIPRLSKDRPLILRLSRPASLPRRRPGRGLSVPRRKSLPRRRPGPGASRSSATGSASPSRPSPRPPQARGRRPTRPARPRRSRRWRRSAASSRPPRRNGGKPRPAEIKCAGAIAPARARPTSRNSVP